MNQDLEKVKKMVDEINSFHSNSLKLSFQAYDFGVPVFHWFVIDKLSNRHGIGIAFSNELALRKAYFEFVERRTLCERGVQDSNGVAAHSDKELAKTAAFDELGERHVFLHSWFTKKCGFLITDEFQRKISTSGSQALTAIRSDKVRTDVRLLGKFNGKFVMALCLSDGSASNRFGAMFAAAIGNTLQSAFDALCLDGIRSHVFLKSREPIQDDDFSESDLQLPKDHLNFFLRPKSSQFFQWFLNSPSVNEVPIYSTSHVSYDEFEVIDTTWPAFVVKANSLDCIPLLRGPLKLDHYFVKKFDLLPDSENRIHPFP